MPNKKEVCPICNRKLRIKCFVFNPLEKKKICTQCDKRIGHNKFYVPFKKKGDYIGKYNLNDLEKKRLTKKYEMLGYGHENALRIVSNRIIGLSKVRTKQWKLKKGIKIKENMDKRKQRELNKKFIEGLK
ncbi:MAG TPA: hypothetical protein ENG87_02160 [Candidatus Pacearchaeota archaeon]|nr:hypothetical protein [Candidatus Pacearchaeota archaeon]